MSIRIGLLAAGRIARGAMVEPARLVDGVEVVAVGSRSLDTARAAADRWELASAYGSYGQLLESDVDAVYISTPAALHREWTLAAIEAGKHVLVEKPLASNAADASVMVEASGSAPHLVVMEGFHWRYHPLADEMRRIIQSGRIGRVEHIEASFDVAGIPRSDIRWNLELGGGALMDLGCYPINWIRFLIGSEPSVTWAQAMCPVAQVDAVLTARLSWLDGTTGTISCSMIAPEPGGSTLRVRGSSGWMQVDGPIAPQNGATLVVDVAGERTNIPVATTVTYVHQLEAFRDAVEDGTPFPTTMGDGAANMAVVDDCYRAAGLDPRPTSVN